MKMTNKFIALLMAMILVAGVLVSCEQPSAEPLQSSIYKATIEISFENDDADLQAAIDAISSSKSTIYVNGDDMKIETSTAMDKISVTDKYTYFGGTLYHESRVSVDGKESVVLEKASLTKENREQLVSDVGAGASIDPVDFNIQEKEGEGGNYTYNCSRITGKAKDSLQAIFAAKFNGFNATVELTGAEYTLKVENDRNESSILCCHFSIAMNGKTYNLTMNIKTDYDYDAVFGISAPAGSSSYNQVSYSEIIR